MGFVLSLVFGRQLQAFFLFDCYIPLHEKVTQMLFPIRKTPVQQIIQVVFESNL